MPRKTGEELLEEARKRADEFLRQDAAPIAAGTVTTKPEAKPAPASYYIGEGLTQERLHMTRQERKTLRGLRKQMRSLEKDMSRAGVEIPEAKEPYGWPTGGLWRAFGWLDRSRNAVATALMAYTFEGERDPYKLTKKLQEGFNIKDPWDAEQRTDTEDFYVELMAHLWHGADSQHRFTLDQQRKLARKAHKAMKETGFPLAHGLIAMEVGGDAMMDPLTAPIPVLRIAKVPFSVAKTVAARTAALTTKALAQSTRGKRVLASTKIFKEGVIAPKAEKIGMSMQQIKPWLGIRGTGIKKLDEMNAARIDMNHASRINLLEERQTLGKEMGKALTEKEMELVPRLAEQKNLTDIETFYRQIKEGTQTKATLDDFEVFRNPQAVGELIRKPPEKAKQIMLFTRRLRNMVDKTTAMREGEGIRVAKLEDQAIHRQGKVLGELNKAVERVTRRKVKEAIATADDISASLKKTIIESKHILPRKTRKQIGERIDEILKDPERMAYGQLDPEDAAESLGEYLKQITPEWIASLRKTADDAVIPAMLRDVWYDSMMSLRDNKKFVGLMAEYQYLEDTIRKTPAYLPHVLGKEAARKHYKYHRTLGKLGKQTRDPHIARDIQRRFVLKNKVSKVPQHLSVEEVQEVVQAKGKWRPARGEKIYKDMTVLDWLQGKPKELANIFEVNPAAITRVMALDTARSTSTANMLTDAIKTFGRLDDVPADWKTITKDAPHIAKKMPGLKDYKLEPETFDAIVRMHDNIFNPNTINHPMVRIYDSMTDYWIRWTLPLFAWFHNRNFWGYMQAAHLGGMFEPWKPMSFQDDMADLVRSITIQGKLSNSNFNGAKRIFFPTPGIPGSPEIDGIRFHRLAIQNGIIDSGYFSAFAPQRLEDSFKPFWKQAKTYWPTSRHNLAIRAGETAGHYMQNVSRSMYFANRLRNGNTVKEAAARTKKIMGDLRNDIYTPFEREYVRRVAPFYGWSRYVTPFLFDRMLNSNKARAKTLAVFRAARYSKPEDIDVDITDLPPSTQRWMEEMVPFPTKHDEKTGITQWQFMKNWWLPADLDSFLGARNLARFGLSELAPWFKLPIAWATGIDPHFETELIGKQGEYLGKLRSSEWIYTLRSLSRLLNEYDRWDPSKKNRYMRPRLTGEQKVLRFLGVSTYRNILEKDEKRWRHEMVKLYRHRLWMATEYEAALDEAAEEAERSK